MADNDKIRVVVYPSTDKITSVISSSSTATITLGHAAVLAPAPEKIPENHQVYSLIGRIASSWANVEHTLDLIIYELAKVDAAMREGAGKIVRVMISTALKYRTGASSLCQ